MATYTLDFRLLGVTVELLVLERHLEIIEQQIAQGREKADGELAIKSRTFDLRDPDDEAEFSLLVQERDFEVDFVQPRVLRGPFLVTLFAVYESAVSEIACRIQARKGVETSLRDEKVRGFLSKAKEYYDVRLQFDLSISNRRWENLRQLSKLRNAIAHANGRLETIGAKKAEELLKVPGISDEMDCIVVSEVFLREIFGIVKDDLEDLVERYKDWDSASSI